MAGGSGSAREAHASALLEALVGAERVLLTGPVNPDGDSIGACLALQRVLAERGIAADVAGTPPHRYAWMPGADAMVADDDLVYSDASGPRYQAVVVLDGDRHRLTPPALAAFERAVVRGIVDHHASTRPDGYTHAWIEPDAASTCAMLYEALPAWGVPLDATLATLLYVGVIFDTGGFRYSNTDPGTHRMAAHLLQTGIPHAEINTRILVERRLEGVRVAGRVYADASLRLDGRLAVGAVPLALMAEHGAVDGDLEGIVDALVHIRGVQVAALLVERRDGSVKYSLRSRGQVDVAEVAQRLAPSGGGHAKAAGASVTASLDEAARLLEPLLLARLDGPA